MLLYPNVGTHPMLSNEAKALVTANPDQFAAHQLLAESLLRLVPPAYTVQADVDRVLLSLALQVNFQLAQGVDPFVLESISSSHTRQSKVFRDRLLSPQAAELVASVVSQYVSENKGWAQLRSHRTDDTTGTANGWFTGGRDVRFPT